MGDSHDADEVTALSIGAIYGGPEHSPWREAVRQLTQRVVTLREGVTSPLNVNVVFHAPGSILSPEFEGTRSGSFRRSDSLLMVQVALPAIAPEDTDAYLMKALSSVPDTVRSWNTRKDRRFDLTALETLIANVTSGGGE